MTDATPAAPPAANILNDSPPAAPPAANILNDSPRIYTCQGDDGVSFQHVMSHSQFNACRNTGARYGDVTEYTVFDKLLGMAELGVDLMNGDAEEYELCLPFAETAAMDWRNSEDGQRMNLPKFQLNSGGHAKEPFDFIKLSYMTWHFYTRFAILPGGKKRKTASYLTYLTIRKNYWSPYNKFCRDYWFLLCPHLPRKEAYQRARSFAKGFVKKYSDIAQLSSAVRRLAVQERLKSQVTSLSDHLKETEAGSEIYYFQDEPRAMAAIKKFLVEVKDVNVPLETHSGDMLSPMIRWLEGPPDKTKPVAEQDIDTQDKTEMLFLKSVVLSPELIAQNDAKEKRRSDEANRRREEERKKLEDEKKLKEEEDKKKKAEKDRREKAKKDKEREKKEKRDARLEKRSERDKQFLAVMRKSQPELEQEETAETLPVYGKPCMEWVALQEFFFENIRDMIEWICVTKKVAVPSWRDTTNKQSYFRGLLAAVGQTLGTFTEADCKKLHMMRESLSTWVPRPWFDCIGRYYACFYELLTSQKIGDFKHSEILDMVIQYMTQKCKPAKFRPILLFCIDDLLDDHYEEESEDESTGDLSAVTPEKQLQNGAQEDLTVNATGTVTPEKAGAQGDLTASATGTVTPEKGDLTTIPGPEAAAVAGLLGLS